MDLPKNSFKAALGRGQHQIGLWSSLCSNIVADIIADSGFDWILLDSEHSPNEVPDLLSQLQALSTGTATAVVRPAWNDAVLIKRILDIGARCVLVPYVQSVGEAERAVAATRYPPHGVRGVTGSGRASKEQIQHAVKNELRLETTLEPNDVADASAVALCLYHSVKFAG